MIIKPNIVESVVRIHNSSWTLSLEPATVIHSNKYSRANGTFGYFVFSTLHSEIVFRRTGTADDIPVYTRNIDLPAYTGQEVNLILLGNQVVGFIDMKTKLYYYTIHDFGRTFGLLISPVLLYAVALIVAVLLYFLQNGNVTAWPVVPFFGAWLFDRLQRLYYNRRLKKSIDQFLT